MADRLRVLDAVCGDCKRIVDRYNDVDWTPDTVTERKAAIVALSLVPFHYETDKPLKAVTGHKPGCANA